MEFKGYKRQNGEFGVRNHILVTSSISCANGVVAALGRQFPDVIAVQNAYGCGTGLDDASTGWLAIAGLMNNPNVGAALIIGLGCEIIQAQLFADAVKGKPVEVLKIQGAGSEATTRKGAEIIKKFQKQLISQKRVTAPCSELLIGLKCGGSDALSGVTANPAVGAAADLFVAEGAGAMITEVTEMIGTAHILKRRCVTPELGEKVENLIIEHEKKVQELLGPLAGMVISPGNMDGGLSSIVEKSLGCITKAGSTPIVDCVGYGHKATKKGMMIMEGPGYDIEAMVGLAASGAQIIIFTTGRGTPAGTPAVPVIKVSTNTKTFLEMKGDIDINAGSVIDEGKSVGDVGKEIFNFTLAVANGKLTCAEVNKSEPFSYLKEHLSV
jgi:altronate dehydratase large subunit